MTRVSKLLAATAIAAFGFTGAANAVYISSFSINYNGQPTANGSTTLSAATSITLPTSSNYPLSINSFSTVLQLGSPTVNGVSFGSNMSPSLSTFQLAGGDTGFTVTWGTANNPSSTPPGSPTGTLFTFTAVTELTPNISFNSGFSSVTFNWVGTMSSSDTVTYPTQSADFTLNFTQSNVGQSIGGGGSFDTPNKLTTVPEPVTMSILGLGLAGLAAARRRRA